jgi:hypothetical protein
LRELRATLPERQNLTHVRAGVADLSIARLAAERSLDRLKQRIRAKATAVLATRRLAPKA